MIDSQTIFNLLLLFPFAIFLNLQIRFIEYLDNYNRVFLVCKKCSRHVFFAKSCKHIKNDCLDYPVIIVIGVVVLFMVFNDPFSDEQKQAVIHKINFLDCHQLYDYFHSYEVGYSYAKQVYIMKLCNSNYHQYLDYYLPSGYTANDLLDDVPKQITPQGKKPFTWGDLFFD